MIVAHCLHNAFTTTRNGSNRYCGHCEGGAACQIRFASSTNHSVSASWYLKHFYRNNQKLIEPPMGQITILWTVFRELNARWARPEQYGLAFIGKSGVALSCQKVPCIATAPGMPAKKLSEVLLFYQKQEGEINVFEGVEVEQTHQADDITDFFLVSHLCEQLKTIELSSDRGDGKPVTRCCSF